MQSALLHANRCVCLRAWCTMHDATVTHARRGGVICNITCGAVRHFVSHAHPPFHFTLAISTTHVERFGYDFSTLCDALANAVRRVSPGASVTVVMHDWGSVWGFHLQLTYPELVKNVIDFDVGFMNARGIRGAPVLLLMGIA
jgi:pimeloyl-ACP methyl ester carboxylesterase